jgi:hypothetical protein
MTAPLMAGIAYYAIVFSAGFLFGTFRVIVLLPILDEAVAVMLELPFMLVISWVASGWLTGYFNVAARPAPRLLMGGMAFGLLMVSEFGISIVAFGRRPVEYFTGFGDVPELLGLSGQVAFGLIPLLQLSLGPRRSH